MLLSRLMGMKEVGSITPLLIWGEMIYMYNDHVYACTYVSLTELHWTIICENSVVY